MLRRFARWVKGALLPGAMLIFLISPEVLADDAKSALDVRGYVTFYQPGRGGAYVDRGGKKISVQIGTNVKAGDVISIGQGAQVKMELSDGPVTLEASNSPFEIKMGRPIPGGVVGVYHRLQLAMDNLFNKMPPSFGHSESKGSGDCPAETGVTSLRPVTALSSTRQRIPAATETLSAAWAGGVPPFVIHLDGAGLAPSSGSQCSRSIDSWPLSTIGPKSSAILTVTDAKNSTIQWSLQFEEKKGAAVAENPPSDGEELETGVLELVDNDPSVHMAGFSALTEVSSTYFFAMRLTQAVKNDEPFH